MINDADEKGQIALNGGGALVYQTEHISSFFERCLWVQAKASFLRSVPAYFGLPDTYWT